MYPAQGWQCGSSPEVAVCVFLLSGGCIICVSLVVTTMCISPVVAICVYMNMYIHVCVQPSSDYTVGFAMMVDIII